MARTPFPHDPPGRAFARLLRQLHALDKEGKNDGEEADAIREQMESLWQTLNATEQERFKELSGDLYSLEREPQPVAMSPPERKQWAEEAKAAFAAGNGDKVDTILAFLRRPFPRDVPTFAIPFLQARCWARLGDLETALLFMQEAERRWLQSYTSGSPLAG
jgi:hypothetical protein